MSASKIRQELFQLFGEREGIQKKILNERSKMIRGSIFEVFTKCSKKNCKCTKGEPHGPFLYMNVIIKGKNIHRYVGKKEDQHLVERLRRYKIFQENVTALNKLNKRISDLFRDYRKALVEEIKDET
jgi:hypothetical protein